MKILSIDLGGSSAKIALIENEQIVRRWKVPTDLSNIWGNIKEYLSDLDFLDIDAIGIAIPGFIDHKNAIIKLSGNLLINDLDINKELKKYFDIPVYILNDANAAALGEYWKGAGKGHDSIILYTIGTGVGGGIVINGKLVYGKDGYAGELGHGGNFQSKYECTCGLKNCMEALSSATGITKLLFENNFTYSVKDAMDLIEKGNKEIRDVFIEALTPLGQHISIMQTALNPDVVIIGGGPSASKNVMLDLINEVVSKHQLDFIMKSSQIKIAETANDAGIWGAAKWVLDNHKKM